MKYAKELTALVVTALMSMVLVAPASAAQPAPPGDPGAVASTSKQQERQWAANRPNRGTHARTVARAATIPNSIRDWAACVIRRESGGNINDWSSGAGARNPASSASGRFQYLDRSWRSGLSYMVRDRLVQFGMPKAQAKKVRLYLAARPIYKWEGVYQQVGFVETVRRGGAFHWRGHSCGMP